MKLFLKLVLALGLLLAGLYLASPFWLPPILASQLPPGWQLEKMKMSWPGWSGITVQHLSVKGELPGLNLRVEAEDSRLSYKGYATEVDSVLLDVFLPSADERPSEPFSIDDLSLPVLHLSAELPVLKVRQTQLALHLSGKASPDSVNAGQPLVFALQGFTLRPDQSNGYHVNTAASIVGQPEVNGQFAVDVTPENLSADIRFPADTSAPAWLNLSIRQTPGTDASSSQVSVLFDSDPAGQPWLDDLLSRSTQGELTNVSGKLEAQASFNGSESHVIEHLTLKGEQLKFSLAGNTVLINADIRAGRQAGAIELTLPTAATIELSDESGELNETLEAAIPGLHRTNSRGGQLTINLADNSLLSIDPADGTQSATALQYSGNFDLAYASDSTNISIDAQRFHLALEDSRQPQNIDLAGLINLNWTEDQPFSYASDTIDLKADSLDLTAAGQLEVLPGLISFTPEGLSQARLPKLQLKIQTGSPDVPAWIDLRADVISTEKAHLGFTLTGEGTESSLDYVFEGPLTATTAKFSVFSAAKPPATIVHADDLALTAMLQSKSGMLSSEGNGYLSSAKITPMEASARKLDLTWSKLNLSELTGDVSSQTHGFKVQIEEDTWTGFDFDLDISLLADEALKGAGKFTFPGGPELPVSFAGNSGTGWWDITVDKSSVPLAKLRGMLKSAHFELPDEIKLTDGSIELAGRIEVHEEISARFDLAGSDIAGDMAESSARKVSFKFDSGYRQDVFFSGPLDVEQMTLAGGIDVANIHTELDVQSTEKIHLSNLSADLFDGQLELAELNFADGVIADTAIYLNQINLQKLLAYLDIDGLEGTGLINFVLPTGTVGQSVHIKDGTFTSTGPGRLSYSKDGASGTNIGLQALQNFQYKKLSGDIAYDSKGPYKIGIRLEGSNPDLYNGYPLIFNLTINGSLPELFEAMFMTGSFDESIMKQINLKQNNGIK